MLVSAKLTNLTKVVLKSLEEASNRYHLMCFAEN